MLRDTFAALAPMVMHSVAQIYIMDTSDRGLLDVERFDLEPNRPPFHGLAGQSIDSSKLKGLSTEGKKRCCVYVLPFRQFEHILIARFLFVLKIRVHLSWTFSRVTNFQRGSLLL